MPHRVRQLTPPRFQEHSCRQKARGHSRLRHGRTDDRRIDAKAFGEARDGRGVRAIRRIEIGGQVDEVGNGHAAIVIQITFLPGDVRATGIEIRRQIYEVGNCHLIVQVQIADAGQANLNVGISVRIIKPRQPDACAGVGGLAGVVNSISGSQ